MTSPMIRYWEKMAFNYMLLAWISALFTVLHAWMGLWYWFWAGLGLTVFGFYVAISSALEIDAQKEITKALEDAKRKKVNALYNKEEEDV